MGFNENLIKQVLEKSNSKNETEAFSEWGIVHIFWSDSTAKCECKHPIKKSVVLRNRETNQKITVGSCCVKKFSNKKYQLVETVLKNMKKIFENNSKVHDDDFFDFCLNKKFINDWECKFMKDLSGRRKLSEKQFCKKINVLNKLRVSISEYSKLLKEMSN